jgi:hypothetical protein
MSKSDAPLARQEISSTLNSYGTPGHPVAFSNANRLKQFFKNKYTRPQIAHFLEGQEAHTKHRQKPKPRVRNPFFVYEKREQVQTDLIDMRKLSKFNNGVNFILVIIDSFTKKAAALGLKTKQKGETMRGMKRLLEGDLRPLPRSIVMDEGKEFSNNEVNDYLKESNIAKINPKGEHKAAIAERFNRTLQALIYRYMTHRGTKRYIHQLQNLIKTYNNRNHRTIGMTPNKADQESNAHLVRQAHEDRYSRIINSSTTKHPKLAVGDQVRVKVWKMPFLRGYNHQFSTEIFRVVKVKLNLPIVMYEIQSEHEADPIRGSFYDAELQKVSSI